MATPNCAAAVLGSLALAGLASGQTLVVPAANTTVEGNGANAFPFSNISQNHRYQQVYAAAEFSGVGPVRITGVRFRPNGTSTFPAWSTTVTIDINFSITQRGPDELESTFANNIGAGETLVLSGIYTYGTQQTGPAPVTGVPLEFDIIFDFQTPFEYDPAQGNLLMDVLRTSTTIGISRFLDTQNPTGDPISRVYSSTPNDLTGSVDSFGLVTQFVYEPLGGQCYANCDASTTEPVLNVADFSCFLQEFAAGSSYANCDNSTTEPVLNVADFTCFLQSFAAGCP